MDTINWNALDIWTIRDQITIIPEDIDNYEKENPMPKDPIYGFESFKNDIINCKGTLTLHGDVKEETAQWVAEFVNEFM